MGVTKTAYNTILAIMEVILLIEEPILDLSKTTRGKYNKVPTCYVLYEF
jgi:hypothetical protein